MKLNYKFIGNQESKKLIVFLHEGLGSIRQWKDFPDKVCAQNNVRGLVYDRSGYGFSPGSLKNRQVTYLHEAAHELDELLKVVIDRPCELYLYGHSDGGSIALIYAADFGYPYLKGIISEAAHVFVEKETIAGVEAALVPFHQGKFDKLQHYHGDRFREVVLAWNTIWLNPLFKHWNIEHKLKAITCPQLIIQGKNDQYGTLKQVESIALNTSGESSIFTPKNCGHAPHKEQQEDVLQKLAHFIHEK